MPVGAGALEVLNFLPLRACPATMGPSARMRPAFASSSQICARYGWQATSFVDSMPPTTAQPLSQPG